MSKNAHDPRELSADKLQKAGIDIQHSFSIALDAGRMLVSKEYLWELGLRRQELKVAENLIKEFYWAGNDSV